MFCAYGDGIVTRRNGVITKDKYGVTALALVTGTEVEGSTPGVSEYEKEGRLQDMHFDLMVTHGRSIRILRSHTLRSNLAPVAGVRYDGL
jgi:hypothetical protein